MVSTNSYMFRHRSDIFRESTKTREHESNTPIQVLIALEYGTPVPKHEGDDTYHELYSMICSYFYFIGYIFWVIYWIQENER